MIKYILLALAIVGTVGAFELRQNPEGNQLQFNPCTDHCQPQIDACNTDMKCKDAMHKCTSACDRNNTCFQNCLHAMGDKAALDWYSCSMQNCRARNTTKTQINQGTIKAQNFQMQLFTWNQCPQHCSPQIQTCNADPKCKDAINRCNIKCHNAMNCVRGCLNNEGDRSAISLFNCAQHYCPSQALQIQASEPAILENIDISPENVGITLKYWYYCPEYCTDFIKACNEYPQCSNTIDRCDFRCQSHGQCNRNCLVTMGNKAAVSLWDCAHQYCSTQN